jgi:ATP adenylyltransferase
MDHLYTPWRKHYIEGHSQRPVCVFCFEPQLEDGPQNLLVYRGQEVYAILNRFPYTSGHLMIVPFAHLESIENLNTAAQVELVQLISHSVRVLRKVYKPDGFNIGANIGAAAGAGIAGHLHIHIVPRWGGDTNFMSSLGDTRVLPETLEETFQRLKDAWQDGV